VGHVAVQQLAADVESTPHVHLLSDRPERSRTVDVLPCSRRVTTRRPIGSLGVPELSEVQSNAVRELLRVSPVAVELGGRFAAAGHALHLGRRVRARRAPGAARRRPRLHDRRPPEQVQALVDGWAEATWSAGIAFGTVGLQRAGFRIEITTYRAEAYDRSSRNPSVTYGDTIADDLVRRDFTVNAMAVALPDWRAPDAFVDLHGGLDDLAAGVLRTPGTPEESFGDDPLRMLRAARFAAQLGFEVAPEVVRAMREMAGRLEIISVERINDELSKLVCAASRAPGSSCS
jgi:poly(A) polymerase